MIDYNAHHRRSLSRDPASLEKTMCLVTPLLFWIWTELRIMHYKAIMGNAVKKAKEQWCKMLWYFKQLPNIRKSTHKLIDEFVKTKTSKTKRSNKRKKVSKPLILPIHNLSTISSTAYNCNVVIFFDLLFLIYLLK